MAAVCVGISVDLLWSFFSVNGAFVVGAAVVGASASVVASAGGNAKES